MQIVATMFWRRLDLPGHDACRLEKHGDGWQLDGAAVFRDEDGQPRPSGLPRALRQAHGMRNGARVRGWIGSVAVDFAIARGAQRRMVAQRPAVPGLAHCTDLDLGFTPATNLLPCVA